MAEQPITFACLLGNRGMNKVYGIYQGHLRNADRPLDQQFINLQNAVQVGTVKVDYASLVDKEELLRPFACKEFPPFITWS